jgi:hypothetical protein
MKLLRLSAAMLFVLPLAASSGIPWDKSPEQWDQSDAYKILRDSPWNPAKVKFEVKYTQRHTDSQTGMVSSSSINSENTAPVRGLELTKNKDLPEVPVLWWSAKTVRLAEQRLRQLRDANGPGNPRLHVDDLPDYVLRIQGSQYFRILQDAREDLHDTVYLEMPDGFTLDLSSVQFFNGSDNEEDRVDFHFPREIEGRPSIDPATERLFFHCKATAKTEHIGEENMISFRAEFHPSAMKAHGQPDF